MNDLNHTENRPPLSLPERARLGLLPDVLPVADILQLEHPTGPVARKALGDAIRAALKFGDLVAIVISKPFQRTVERRVGGWLDGNPDWDTRRTVIETGETKTTVIDRNAYRAWRNTCPAELLSPLSQIQKWLGATPGPEPAASILPVETSLPESPEPAGIALVEAENAALVALRKRLKREPDFDEFWDYLTTKDETGTVADFTDDRVDWVGKSGKSCSTSKSTFRNRLTAAKKRNPFTPV